MTILVATQMDSPDGQERTLWRNIWERVGEHLEYYRSETRQIVLAEKILNTSAKNVNVDQIRQLVSSLATLIVSSELTQQRQNGIPKIWTSLITSF